jgi:hypothetical protein
MPPEFWAAVAGAIVGALAGGGVTWALQTMQDWRHRRERDRALARSLIFKLMRIHSDLHGFNKHVDECATTAQAHGLPQGWQSLRAIGNLPARISFSPEEMSYLLSLKKFELFNKVASLDVVHSSTIGIFEMYAARRMELTDMLPASSMQGAIGTTTMTPAQFAAFIPRATELDLLATDIKARVKEDSEESRQALVAVNAAAAVTFGQPLKLEIQQ